MLTSLRVDDTHDAALATSARVIKSCVRHGFCPQTCPTYILLGDENDSPRGRIDLIRRMFERGGAPDARTVTHLDRCLSCLGCETTCAARVDYRRLIDHARAHIERHFRRPLGERLARLVVAHVLPYPRRLRAALAVARRMRGFARVWPAALQPFFDALPSQPLQGDTTSAARPACTSPTRRVALLAGCVQQVMGQSINRAARAVLERQACAVTVIEKPACCGALSLHIGHAAAARAHARRMVVALERELDGGAEAVIVTSAGCGTTLKDYAHVFATEPGWIERARRVAAHVRDFAEYLDAIGFEPAADLPALPIAYHDACSLRHGQRVTAAPRRLLARAGFEVREVPEGHLCCGSAGSYNLLQPEIAARLGARKATALAATGAVAFVAGNLGCLAQLGRYSALAPMHTAELLAYASGAARPAALAGIDPSLYPPRKAAASAPAAEDEINFWIYAPEAADA